MDRRAAEAAACVAPLRAGAGKPHFPENLALHLTWPASRLLGLEVALPWRGIPAGGALPRAHKPSSSGVLEMTQESSGCPRGLWTCRGAAQPPPRGQMSRGDTRSTTKLQHDWEGGGGREIPVAPALRAEGWERGGSRCQTPPPSSQRSPRWPPSPNDISSFPETGASGPWGACPPPEEPP